MVEDFASEMLSKCLKSQSREIWASGWARAGASEHLFLQWTVNPERLEVFLFQSVCRVVYTLYPCPKILSVCSVVTCCRSQELSDSNCNYASAAVIVHSCAFCLHPEQQDFKEQCKAWEDNASICAFLNLIWHPSAFHSIWRAKCTFVLFTALLPDN